MTRSTKQMAALLLAASLSAIPSQLAAQSKCHARLDGDTLTIGNDMVERKFLWNNGDLKTVTLSNKADGWILATKGQPSDFSLAADGGKAHDGTFATTVVKPTYGNNGCLVATVMCKKGSVELMRRFRMFDGCPAIQCEYFVRGSLQAMNAQSDNAVDRKNIEGAGDMATMGKEPVVDRLKFDGKQWKVRTVEFWDATDWNDNLVESRDIISYRKTRLRGNLLFATDNCSGKGFFFLKESPCSSSQLNYMGADFTADFGSFAIISLGVSANDITPDNWTQLYSCVVGVYTSTELNSLLALRNYQKQLRRLNADRDEMIMCNTWGDRSQDSKVDEAFCMKELDAAARMGLTCLQIDDGWQYGKSPNSKVAKGTFTDIYKDNEYWQPDKRKFPNGLATIAKKARKLGIKLGLWFNPSIQNDFADWRKDAGVIIGLHKKYGIDIFKIDGLNVTSKTGERRLKALFDSVATATDGKVVLNLDVTAGRRGGYHMFNEYGNVFLENRYTDWGNYYPCHTLRNLWALSRYVPAEKLQVEFLNKWRNGDKYPAADRFAPREYSFEYLFATTMAGQPLAWMETSALPEEAFTVSEAINKYKTFQHELHSGTILPIGDEPDGTSWTGFQSIVGGDSGYLIIYREDCQDNSNDMATWLPDGKTVRLTPLMGDGETIVATVGKNGKIRMAMKNKNSYAVYKYSIL